ncbi:MAG: phosphotransferase [Actinomycetaceae bacterium]|nr:phosphotransferase [Arcanobacterium sp.]MDD7686783.1 phosphotransferase [Actinomycetaceae bacterium]MDY5272634.1 phosphotransferase [Arcanobacterium sp.]
MKLSPLHLAALAVAAVDGLNVAGTRPPYITTDDFMISGVIDSEGRHWIVKYPRTDQGGTSLEAESALASALIDELREGRLSFDVIHPKGYATLAGRRAVVYPAPLGKARRFETMDERYAREVGRTLAAIHSLNPAILTRVGLPAYDAAGVRERLLTELDDATEAARIPAVLRRRWLNMFDDDALWDFRTAAVHGDIADENFLWSETTIRTVVGFGEAHVGDPAVDIAPLLSSFSRSAFDEFFEAYSHTISGKQAAADSPALTPDLPAVSDPHVLERATLLSEFALVRWLMHGILTDDPEVIDDASTMLDQLALEIDSDPETSPGPAWHLDSPTAVHGDAIGDVVYGDRPASADAATSGTGSENSPWTDTDNGSWSYSSPSDETSGGFAEESSADTCYPSATGRSGTGMSEQAHRLHGVSPLHLSTGHPDSGADGDSYDAGSGYYAGSEAESGSALDRSVALSHSAATALTADLALSADLASEDDLPAPANELSAHELSAHGLFARSLSVRGDESEHSGTDDEH